MRTNEGTNYEDSSMQKVIAMSKFIGSLGTRLVSLIYIAIPASAFAEKSTSLSTVASRINGESLVYFILLIFIAYLFFRKPLP